MPSSVRLAADSDRLRALAAASRGRITLVALPTPGSPRFVLDLGFVTAGSSAYPAERRTNTRLVIDLPARYPFMPPAATIATPIFHPNVYPSGLVCLGTKWLPSEGMDLFVRRIAQLVTFDPLIVNAQSAANAGCASLVRAGAAKVSAGVSLGPRRYRSAGAAGRADPLERDGAR